MYQQYKSTSHNWFNIKALVFLYRYNASLVNHTIYYLVSIEFPNIMLYIIIEPNIWKNNDNAVPSNQTNKNADYAAIRNDKDLIGFNLPHNMKFIDFC